MHIYLVGAVIHRGNVLLESCDAEGWSHSSLQFLPSIHLQLCQPKLIDDPELPGFVESKQSEVIKVCHLNSLDKIQISEEDAGFIGAPEDSKSMSIKSFVMININIFHVLAEEWFVAPEPMRFDSGKMTPLLKSILEKIELCKHKIFFISTLSLPCKISSRRKGWQLELSPSRETFWSCFNPLFSEKIEDVFKWYLHS